MLIFGGHSRSACSWLNSNINRTGVRRRDWFRHRAETSGKMVKRKKRSNMCPCSVCRKDCLKTKALRCSMCDTWMHVNCIQRELCETQYQSWLERTDFLCLNCCFIPESDDFDCQHSLLRLRESLNNGRTGDLLKVAEREDLLMEAYLINYPSITNIGHNFIDDNLSLRLLSECKDTFLDKTDLKPCKIEEDGNCFYRSVSLGLYGTQNEHVYLRLLTALEVLNNKEFYIRLVGPDSNELGDCRFVLPTFDNLVSSIVTLGGYADIVHFYALSAAIKSPIQSVYPQLPDDNSLTEVYSRKVVGRGVDGHNNAVLAVLWTMTDSTERKVGVFTPNHFVPLLDNNQLGTANGTLFSTISRTNKDGSPQKVALVKRPTQEKHKTDMDSQKDLTISFEEKPFRGNNKVMTFHENKKGQHLRINLPNDSLFRREELFSADGVKFELVPNSHSRTIPCLLHIRAKGRKFSMDFKCIYRNKQYDVELISCQNAFSCCTIQVNARVLATSSKKSIYSNGKFILASQQSLLIESRIKSPWICLQCTGNARLSPEANIETQHLELIGSTVFVDNCINYIHVQNEKVSKQNPSKLTVLVTGDLHIGRDAFIGMGEHRKNTLSELEIKITGDLCNHGQIKANDVLLLVCTNIRSCHKCKTDTSQNYLKALTETNEVNQSSIDREIDTSKPSVSAVMAARNGDTGYVHKLLSSGMDTNAPLCQNGRSLSDEARMSWMKIRRESNNIQGISSPKLNIVRQRADITDKLLDAWNRRSGIITSISLVCDLSGNIDALGQLSCEQLNLKVKGNVIVEENSICTLGEISGKVCGAVQIHGTMKIRKFKEFEAGTFMLKQNSGLFVGDGGDLNVIHLLKNEGYFYHENNGLIITTGEFETTVESRIELHTQLHVHIREDSKYLLGTIEANIVDLKFSAKCTNSCSLSATELCQFTFVHVENKCSQLENLSSIKVQKGHIEMKSNGYDNSSYDFINRGNVSTFGVYAESASIEVCQNSSFDVYPNSSEKRNFNRKGASIDVRAKNIKMEKSGKINMHVNDTVSSINLRCQGHLFQYGCIDIVPSSCAKHQLNIHVEQYIYEGSIENGQQLNLKIDQHMHSSEYMTAEAGITIEGEGALYNESGAYLHCPNGCINVIGSARIVNRKGARIKGKGVGMETMQCQNHINEPEPLDFINEGVVESDDEITIHAGNIANTGRLQSFNKSSGIELCWFGGHNSVMVLVKFSLAVGSDFLS